MSLRVSGKNLDIGDAFRSHVEIRISDALEKYFGDRYSGHVTLEREGSGFKSECTIHLDTGIVLRSDGHAQDARQSFDLAADRIEKRLRRYKRKLKEHHAASREEGLAAASYVIAAPGDDEEVAADYHPTIIAEEATDLARMTVGAAVMAMDLADMPALVFRHAAHGRINVVYRRSDGHIGWVDPSLESQPSLAQAAPPVR